MLNFNSRTSLIILTLLASLVLPLAVTTADLLPPTGVDTPILPPAGAGPTPVLVSLDVRWLAGLIPVS